MEDLRTILHVDMDAFFAAVEQRDFPELRGRPVLVGGSGRKNPVPDEASSEAAFNNKFVPRRAGYSIESPSNTPGRRGVVTTASYEARPFGCRSAMPMSVALRLCPQAIVVPTRFGVYQQVSRQILSILRRYSGQIQPVSIDEAFLDVTGSARLFGDGVAIARRIRADILSDTGLTASVGVALNKFLAKLASDLEKPDGLTVITSDTVDTILPLLAIGRMWGIGERTNDRLTKLGVRTIGDLRRMSPAWFTQHFGSGATRMQQLIRGQDDRSVHPGGAAKSIGHEKTFGQDVVDATHVRSTLLEQAEAVGERVRRQRVYAGLVQIKIRTGDFKTVTRSTYLSIPTDQTGGLFTAARQLFDEWARNAFAPVRLVGLQAGRLTREAQLGLFQTGPPEQLKRVDQTLDIIRQRFGRQSIRHGR